MAARRAFNGLVANARRDSLKLVKCELRKCLPSGWRVHLAVGWGLTVFDANGHVVVGTYENAPSRLPKGLRKALSLAADFCDTFGYGNECIVGVGSKRL